MQVNNILIVDDDEEDREFFTAAVSEIDPQVQVSTAGSKEELLYQLKQQVPDLLFIDSLILHHSGLDSVKEIRSDSSFEDLPIIMYTGSCDIKNIAKAFSAGASSYIVKPYTLPEIKAVLEVMLKKDWSNRAECRNEYYKDKSFTCL